MGGEWEEMEKKTHLDILCEKKHLFPIKEMMSYFEQGTKDYFKE